MPLIYLIFCEHLIYFVGAIKLMPLLYAGAVILVVLGLLSNRTSFRVATAILAYVTIILVCTLYGVLTNGDAAISFQESFYYLKPLLFFMLGYFFLRPELFAVLARFLFWFSLAGSLVFYLYSDTFIRVAAEHAGVTSYGYYEAFGLLSRDISWYLSPLEFSALCMFLTFYFSTGTGDRSRTKTIVSVLMIIATLSRSVLIGAFVAYAASKLKPRAITIATAIMVASVLVAIAFAFSSFFFQFMVSEGSASVHYENLFSSAKLISAHPLGFGIGASGFPGYGSTSLKHYFYSEGTIPTMLIEIGWTAVPLLVLLGYGSFKVSSDFGCLYLGFMFSSLFVPVGLSTYFICLYFLYYGMKLSGLRHLKNSIPADRRSPSLHNQICVLGESRPR